MIPVSNDAQQVITNYSKGNFSLWFNKLIDLDEGENFKPTGHPAQSKERILKKYGQVAANSGNQDLLEKKHSGQDKFLSAFAGQYIPLVFTAKLKTRLITGLGQTHPTETGMVFEHNIGVPYIPASSIKGLVRFAHRLEVGLGLDESKDAFPETLIPAIFGGDSKEEKKKETYRGQVIFLDAYPETVPQLELDIMNPHYGPYYMDDRGTKAPGDWYDPVPVKFLTVAAGTVFIFRALVPKDRSDLLEAVKKAYSTALTQEGVGAKTAVGYGRFTLETNNKAVLAAVNDSELSMVEPTGAPVKETGPAFGTKEYWLDQANQLEPQHFLVDAAYQSWQNDENWKADPEIALSFQSKIKTVKSNGKPTAAKKRIDEILGQK